MTFKQKKNLYIALFILLWILLGLLFHGLTEIYYSRALINDFTRYSLGYSWQQWFTFHHYASVVIFLASVLIGWQQGRMWWRWVYEQKRFDPLFRRLQKLLYGKA